MHCLFQALEDDKTMLSNAHLQNDVETCSLTQTSLSRESVTVLYCSCMHGWSWVTENSVPVDTGDEKSI